VPSISAPTERAFPLPAAALAAYGLRSRHVLPRAPLDAAVFEELLDVCAREGVLGVFATAVREGALPLDAPQRARLELEWQRALVLDVRLEQVLLDAVDCLARASTPSRVLEGVALAHTAYADPATRLFSKVDVLVPAARFADGVAALVDGLGNVDAVRELRPDSGGSVVLRVRGALELEVHQTLVAGSLGRAVGFDDLFAPPYRFPLGAYELEGIPMPQRLLQAVGTALGDGPGRLVARRDVAQLVLRERPHLIDVLMMARRWRCEAMVARAITAAWRDLQLVDRPPILEWAEQFPGEDPT
jgi:Uncharacterised nucleotidyltransferase